MGGMIRLPFPLALVSLPKLLSLLRNFLLFMLYLVDLCTGIVSRIDIHPLIDLARVKDSARSGAPEVILRLARDTHPSRIELIRHHTEGCQTPFLTKAQPSHGAQGNCGFLRRV